MKNKITYIHLIPTGGIGNQFFQYSFARNINHNIPGSRLIIDKSTYSKYKLRSFVLDEYSLNKEVDILDSSLSIYWRIKYHFYRGIHRLLYKITPRKSDGLKHFSHRIFTFFANRGWIICLDSDFHKLNFEKLKRRKKIIIFGYFQSISYFDGISELIKKEFKPKSSLSKTAKTFLKRMKQNNNESLALSFRCSDYKSLGYFIEDLQPGYTNTINKLILSDFSNCEKVLFTEDIESCKRYISNPGEYLNGYSFNTVEQLYIMSQCDVFFLTNSTFCWLAAFLSESKNKRIFAPKMWLPQIQLTSLGLFYKGINIVEFDGSVYYTDDGKQP